MLIKFSLGEGDIKAFLAVNCLWYGFYHLQPNDLVFDYRKLSSFNIISQNYNYRGSLNLCYGVEQSLNSWVIHFFISKILMFNDPATLWNIVQNTCMDMHTDFHQPSMSVNFEKFAWWNMHIFLESLRDEMGWDIWV